MMNQFSFTLLVIIVSILNLPLSVHGMEKEEESTSTSNKLLTMATHENNDLNHGPMPLCDSNGCSPNLDEKISHVSKTKSWTSGGSGDVTSIIKTLFREEKEKRVINQATNLEQYFKIDNLNLEKEQIEKNEYEKKMKELHANFEITEEGKLILIEPNFGKMPRKKSLDTRNPLAEFYFNEIASNSPKKIPLKKMSVEKISPKRQKLRNHSLLREWAKKECEKDFDFGFNKESQEKSVCLWEKFEKFLNKERNSKSEDASTNESNNKVLQPKPMSPKGEKLMTQKSLLEYLVSQDLTLLDKEAKSFSTWEKFEQFVAQNMKNSEDSIAPQKNKVSIEYIKKVQEGLLDEIEKKK